jgi:ketosteroid isomerase-like protein
MESGEMIIMPYCPKCGAEVSESYNFCWRCGFSIRNFIVSTPEDAVRSVIIARIEGIKSRDINAVKRTINEENYTKFDDWPPFNRQEHDALRREADALQVLKEYNYKVDEWRIDIFDDAAVASFIINYNGQMRNRKFYIKSRVSVFLIRKNGEWRIVHEHWSRFPESF